MFKQLLSSVVTIIGFEHAAGHYPLLTMYSVNRGGMLALGNELLMDL